MTREQELEAALRNLVAKVPASLLGQLDTIDSCTMARGTKEFPALRAAVADAKKLLGLNLLDA